MLRRVLLLTAVSAVALSACSKKKPEVITPQGQTPPSTQTTTDTAAANARARERARQDSIASANSRAAADAAERERILSQLRASLEQAIYFEYDQDQLSPEAMQILAQKVQILRANAGIRLRITGHTDERGSVEYNLALGMRRAQVVKDYISGFPGVDESRLEIVSMGEDQPADPGHDESAWGRNRRAGFTITSGNALTVPGQ